MCHKYTVCDSVMTIVCFVSPSRWSSARVRSSSRGPWRPASPPCWKAERPPPQTLCSHQSLRSWRARRPPAAGWRVWCPCGWSCGSALWREIQRNYHDCVLISSKVIWEHLQITVVDFAIVAIYYYNVNDKQFHVNKIKIPVIMKISFFVLNSTICAISLE